MKYLLIVFFSSLGLLTQNEVEPIITLRLQDQGVQDKKGNFILNVEAISNVKDVYLDGINVRLLLDKAQVETVAFANPIDHYVFNAETRQKVGNVKMTDFNFKGNLLYVSDFLTRKGDAAQKIAHESEGVWTYLFQVVVSPEQYEKGQKYLEMPVVWDEKTSGEGFIPGSSGVELSLADPEGGPSYAAKVSVIHANWTPFEKP